MPRLPRISSKKAIKALESLGFKQTRQTGSHVIMKKSRQMVKLDVSCQYIEN